MAEINFREEARRIGDSLKNAQLTGDALGKKTALKQVEVFRQLVKAKGKEDDYKNFLRWGRTRKILTRSEEYELNAIEQAECPEECEYVQKINGGMGSYIELGDMVKFNKRYDDIKGQDLYTFYVNVTKSPEDQETKEIEWKRNNGVMVTEDDFKKEYTQVHRFQLYESEFTKYFNP